MGRLLGMFGALLAYLCIATVGAMALLVGYGWTNGRLTEDKLLKMVAVANDVPLAPPPSPTGPAASDAVAEQGSLDDVLQARALKTRDIELREMSLNNSMTVTKGEYEKLVDEKDRYERIKTAFKAQLDEYREGAAATSRENARLILENMKPKQAKEQILRMVQDGESDDVVALLTQMPTTKRAKIINEFKTDEESTTFAEIFKLIREGVPETPLIDDTKRQLERPRSAGP